MELEVGGWELLIMAELQEVGGWELLIRAEFQEVGGWELLMRTLSSLRILSHLFYHTRYIQYLNRVF